MTTTVKSQTRQTLSRSWRDLDPKIIVSGVFVIVASIALVILFLQGHISATTLEAGVGTGAPAVLLGYLKASSHRDLVYEVEQGIETAETYAPLLEAAYPAAAPVVQEAEGILHSIGLPYEATPAPAAPAPLAPTEAVAVTPGPQPRIAALPTEVQGVVSTGTLTLSPVAE